jgi:hypothetical protein
MEDMVLPWLHPLWLWMLQMVSLMEDVLEHPLHPLRLDTDLLLLELLPMVMEDTAPPWVVPVWFQ